jgi:hypothetical protein
MFCIAQEPVARARGTYTFLTLPERHRDLINGGRA